MSIIQFPNNPTLYQTFTVGSKTWIWNGYAWDLQTANTTNLSTVANNALLIAQAAYNNSNSSFNTANSAYNVANLSFTVANSAWNTANTANTTANIALSVAQSGYNNANAAFNTANAGYNVANLSFAVANSALSTAQAAYNNSNSSFNTANAGYNVANTANATANIALSVAQSSYGQANSEPKGTAAYNVANLSFNVANAAFNTANAGYTVANLSFAVANAAFNTANAGYNVANLSFVVANAAFNTANAGYNVANLSFVVANSAWFTANTANATANIALSTAQAGYNNSNGAFNTANAGYNVANLAYSAANSKLSTSGGTINGSLTITNNLTVNGNVSYVGNVNSILITGNTGEFFGNTGTGFNALYAGVPVGFVFEPQTVLQITGNYNGYSQANHQNINSGNNSSTDVICTADNGNNNDTFIDLGINSSTYIQAGFGLTVPNDGYLYVQGNTATGGGNLILATMANNDIIFATSGQNANNEQGRWKNNVGLVIKQNTSSVNVTSGALQVAGGAGISGNVYAGAVYSGGTLVLTAEPTGNAAYNTANAGYTVANLSFAVANAAFNTANAGYNVANLSFNVANASFNTANAGYNVANLAFAVANSGFNTANAGYNVANLSFVVANSAWNTANTANGTANIALSVAQSSYGQANSEPKGTAAYNVANLAFNVANAAFNTANASYNVANLSFDVANSAWFTANTANATANIALSVAQSGYNNSNGAFNTANAGYNVANLSFAVANSALPNTGSIITVNSRSILVVSNTTSSTSNTTGALVVSGGIGTSGNVVSTQSFAAQAASGATTQATLLCDNTGPRVDFGTIVTTNSYMRVGAYNNINNIDTYTRDFRIGSTAVSNILYANNVTGSIGVGISPIAGQSFNVAKQITGGVYSMGVRSTGTIQSDVTTQARGFDSGLGTSATSFTLGSLVHYYASPAAFGSGSTVTSQIGFQAESNLTGATNNYGFYSNIPTNANTSYNFYAAGTAPNYFSGNTTFGTSVTANNGIYSKNNFTGTYTDGIVVDYVNGNGRISVGPADGITLYNGGVGNNQILSVNANGSIGVANTVPSGWINGWQSIDLSQGSISQNPSGSMYFTNNAYNEGTPYTWVNKSFGLVSQYALNGNGTHEWFNNTTYISAGQPSNLARVMILDNQGRLGIGSGNPSYTLDVAGTANTTGLYATSIAVSNTTSSTNTTTGALTVSGGVGISGNVYTTGIYATSFSGSGTGLTNIPNSGLANSSVTINGSLVSLGGSTTISAGATITDDTTTNATRYIMLGSATSGAYTAANTSSTKLYYNPSIGTLYATIFQSLSDETQKTNIVPIINATDTIKQIGGFEFDWKDNGQKSAGTIAQQLEKILPWLVSENDGIKSVNYAGLIAYLIESNKELADRIEKLENK